MKLLIASDLHGSAHYCRELLEAYDREQADRLLLLGDILYHGPRNDLPEEYAPKAVAAKLNERKKDILCPAIFCSSAIPMSLSGKSAETSSASIPALCQSPKGIHRTVI